MRAFKAMSKKQYSAEEFEDAVSLANVRAALVAHGEKVKAFYSRVRSDTAHIELCRKAAWARVGKVSADKPNAPMEEWHVPKGWPEPYASRGDGVKAFELFMEIEQPGFWDGERDGPSTGLMLSGDEKHLKAFRKALEGSG